MLMPLGFTPMHETSAPSSAKTSGATPQHLTSARRMACNNLSRWSNCAGGRRARERMCSRVNNNRPPSMNSPNGGMTTKCSSSYTTRQGRRSPIMLVKMFRLSFSNSAQNGQSYPARVEELLLSPVSGEAVSRCSSNMSVSKAARARARWSSRTAPRS